MTVLYVVDAHMYYFRQDKKKKETYVDSQRTYQESIKTKMLSALKADVIADAVGFFSGSGGSGSSSSLR